LFRDVTGGSAVAVEERESFEFLWSEDKVVGWKSEFDRDSADMQMASKAVVSRIC
jgi:hypothetical protein